MIANYISTLQQIFRNISSDSSESDVEKKVIVPLLQMLGYSPTDWEPQAVVGKCKLDFLILPPTSEIPYAPYLVIEAKAPGKNIAQSTWQINDYMRKTAAFIGLLTNGYEFRIIYNIELKPKVILNYSQKGFIDNFKLIYKLLSKQTCLILYKTLYKNEQNLRSKLLEQISKLFRDEKILTNVSEKVNPEIDNRLSNQKKEEKKAMIITVFNNKGGVGKTTTTINLAAALNKLGKRVLLIDIDAQANLTTGLGIDPLEDVEYQGKKDIVNLLLEPRTKIEDVVMRTQWEDVQLDIIPSHIRLSRKETELNQTVDSDRLLAKKLKKHDYDYVLIDPPPSFGKVNGISLMASSAILIPTQLSAYAIRALEYVLERTNEVEQLKDEPLPILGIAVSMYDQKSSSYNKSMVTKLHDILEKAGGTNKVKLFPEDTWIPRLNIVSVCQDKGYPLYQGEFDNQLTYQEKESAQKILDRYFNLAEHFIKLTSGETIDG